MKPKIVQIACSESSYPRPDGTTQWIENLYALCDDGTLWLRYSDGNEGREWRKLKDINHETNPRIE